MCKNIQNQNGISRVGVIAMIVLIVIIIVVITLSNTVAPVVLVPDTRGILDQATEVTCNTNMRALASITAMADVPTTATFQDLIRLGYSEYTEECPSGGRYTNNSGRWSCSIHQ